MLSDIFVAVLNRNMSPVNITSQVYRYSISYGGLKVEPPMTRAPSHCTGELIGTRWCPSSLAKLVNITPVTMVYARCIYYIYIYTIPMVYKPTYPLVN